jgi:hypothetical protein
MDCAWPYLVSATLGPYEARRALSARHDPVASREMEQMFAKDEARRQRRAEKQRRRREQSKALYWVERGYGAKR